MSAARRHVVVGTAGHIDHGKTSLVKALTGTDTDRLPEEKARGITIDLGFAFLEEPDGLTIEVVDVPGHERFVKNMLAGVGGIDLAMLVIAADEGVMPQTREHLAICSLLHIRTGLVVLTKTDTVESDWIELVRDDVATLVRGTFLEGAPVVPLSATTLADVGLGIIHYAPRPLKSRDRVRLHAGTSEIMARALLLEGAELAPGKRGFARLRLEAPLVALAGDRFVIRSYSPIVTIGGGTLLDTDPPRLKRPARLAHLNVLESGAPEAVVEEHVRGAGVGGIRLPALVARVPFGPARTRRLLDALAAAGRVTAVDRDWSLHADAVARLRGLVTPALEQFHRAQPLRGGMSREELRVRSANGDERVFAHVLGALDAEGAVRVDRDKVRLAAHELRLSAVQQTAVDRLEREFREAAAAPPSAEEALGRAGLAGDEEHELFQLLVESRKLVRVKESLFFHAAALEAIQDKLVALLRERKEIGPGDVKDLLGISRKYAIPLLEYFDALRVTTRVGERRVLRGG